MPSHEQLTTVLDAAATVLAHRQQQMLTVEEWADDPAGFVASMNLHRRHLTTNQRAMIAARLSGKAPHRPSERVQDCTLSMEQAAAAFKVPERSVQLAASVLASGGPALVDAVTQGQVSVSAAEQVATGGPHVVQNSGPGVGAGGGSSDSRVRTSPTRR